MGAAFGHGIKGFQRSLMAYEDDGQKRNDDAIASRLGAVAKMAQVARCMACRDVMAYLDGDTTPKLLESPRFQHQLAVVLACQARTKQDVPLPCENILAGEPAVDDPLPATSLVGISAKKRRQLLDNSSAAVEQRVASVLAVLTSSPAPMTSTQISVDVGLPDRRAAVRPLEILMARDLAFSYIGGPNKIVYWHKPFKTAYKLSCNSAHEFERIAEVHRITGSLEETSRLTGIERERVRYALLALGIRILPETSTFTFTPVTAAST